MAGDDSTVQVQVDEAGEQDAEAEEMAGEIARAESEAQKTESPRTQSENRGLETENPKLATENYRERLKGRRPKKGIPSADVFFLPRKDSLDALLGKQSAIKTSTAWNLEDVLQFVFPVEYRGSMHAAASSFLKLLQKNGGSLHSAQIGEFVGKSGVSKATFYNKVIPRLARVGMIERNREAGSRRLSISWSGQFSIYLEKIAFEWKRLEPEKKVD